MNSTRDYSGLALLFFVAGLGACVFPEHLQTWEVLGLVVGIVSAVFGPLLLFSWLDRRAEYCRLYPKCPYCKRGRLKKQNIGDNKQFKFEGIHIILSAVVMLVCDHCGGHTRPPETLKRMQQERDYAEKQKQKKIGSKKVT